MTKEMIKTGLYSLSIIHIQTILPWITTFAKIYLNNKIITECSFTVD